MPLHSAVETVSAGNCSTCPGMSAVAADTLNHSWWFAHLICACHCLSNAHHVLLTGSSRPLSSSEVYGVSDRLLIAGVQGMSNWVSVSVLLLDTFLATGAPQIAMHAHNIVWFGC